MTGFIDVSCPKCHRKHGWFGEMAGRPPCPRCGHKVDPQELAEVQAKMDEYRRLAATKPADADVIGLQQMRVEAGLTLRQAAKQLGIAPSLLSDCENGRCRLSPELAQKMGRLYDCGE